MAWPWWPSQCRVLKKVGVWVKALGCVDQGLRWSWLTRRGVYELKVLGLGLG